MRNNLLVLIIINLIFCNCSSIKVEKSDKVEQRIIFPQYSVIYNSDNETLVASVQFNKNNPAGILIKLSAHSSVSFNGNLLKMVEQKENGRLFYQYKNAESFPKKVVFEYINDEKNIFINSITINSFEIKEKKKKITSKGEKIYFSFSGSTFSEDETLEAIFSNEQNEVLYTFTPEVNNNRVIILPEMVPVKNGRYFLHFVRRENSSKVNAMDRGGLIETEYHSKKVEIIV